MIHLFLDTNSVIDFLTDRKPFSSLAGRLFDYSVKGEVKLYLSAVSYNNIYYVVRKVSSHKETIRILSSLIEMTEVIDSTSSIIKDSLNSEFNDFEDALQYFSALSADSDVIISNNPSDFHFAEIPVKRPDDFLRML